ncbi:hypothetical protein pb186bvf_001744 [Paramecium bursaria]
MATTPYDDYDFEIKRRQAQLMDELDPLNNYKELFFNGNETQLYLDGNSLGRLPKKSIEKVNKILLEDWGTNLVQGWEKWINQNIVIGDLIGEAALGAKKGQVICQDTTSVCLYQLCYAAIKARPDKKTIITDAANFPTDRYILEGLAQQHGLKLIIINNETIGDQCERIDTEILANYLNQDVALVLLQVIQYRSGSRNPMKEITKQVRELGGLVVWDASHATGAIKMNFDEDSIDLAVGCTYKYCNSGPGAPAWLFVRENLQNQLQVPIQGWFAQENQFQMGPHFQKAQGIRGFATSGINWMSLECARVSFEMIKEAGIDNMQAKSSQGTELMIELFDLLLKDEGFELVTPRKQEFRGGHITLYHKEAYRINLALRQYQNVIPDYRVPNQLRFAISPLASSYTEILEAMYRIKSSMVNKEYEKQVDVDAKVS